MKPSPTSNDTGVRERKTNYQDYITKRRTIPEIFYYNPPFVQAAQDFEGIQDSTHLRPEYASYKARLATFDDWPEAASQRPQLLAKAGFYYTEANNLDADIMTQYREH
ncbi:hypothetical protein MAR_017797, partial [Mya arenaria]